MGKMQKPLNAKHLMSLITLQENCAIVVFSITPAFSWNTYDSKFVSPIPQDKIFPVAMNTSSGS